ncbi:MAG TPA: glycosyltransferase [Isosphaeraceae bacterium]|nr:glycosyltransferase [Isosphaeraceae bacterium]
MAITPTQCRPELEPAQGRLALTVADANWFTTENLFREVRRDNVATLLLKCLDYLNAWRRGMLPRAWGPPLVQRGPALWQRDLILPSGWMKRFPNLGMRPIERSIRDWHREHARDARLGLVMTYPHYLYLRDLVRPDRQVYFNIDDYTQYWPRFAHRINELEQQAVREADLTVCVSRLRAEELRAAVPEATDRIRHLPHGSPTSSLSNHPWERPAPPPADLAPLPRPLLGYVGTLEDRIDWKLLTRLSETLPHASIVIVGRPGPKRTGAWYVDCCRCLARPNVHAPGWRPQELIHQYNRAFDVCLIPYRTDHPFNRVCCPTKIMDYMGTGRPIVSTALPECLLYDHLFHVAGSDEEFLASVRSILDARSDDGRAARRFEWARANTCRRVVDRLLNWLPE